MKYESIRQSNSLTQRFEESKRILTKYPDRIPVILEKNKYNERQSPNLDRYKYLIDKDNTLSVLLYHIRKRIKLDKSEAIYLFVNGTVYSPSILMGELYEKEKDKEDNFLYLTYSTENTFG